MSGVLPAVAPVQPTNAAPLPRLFAYTTSLGLERFLDRRKRGLPTLVLSLVWLTLTWRGRAAAPCRLAAGAAAGCPAGGGPPAHRADLAPRARLFLGT